MLLERLNEIINIKPTEKKTNHGLKKCYAFYEYNLSNHNVDSVVPAVTKSAGFTGMPARLAKPRLLHSKQ